MYLEKITNMVDSNYIWSYFFPMKKGFLDDDYFFYEDGRILHSYDKTQLKLNIEEFVSAESIPIEKRMTMLKKCPAEIFDEIKSLLKLP